MTAISVQDLDEIWETEYKKWEGVCAEYEDEDSFGRQGTVQLNPQQMRLVSRYFDRVLLSPHSFVNLCSAV